MNNKKLKKTFNLEQIIQAAAERGDKASIEWAKVLLEILVNLEVFSKFDLEAMKNELTEQIFASVGVFGFYRRDCPVVKGVLTDVCTSLPDFTYIGTGLASYKINYPLWQHPKDNLFIYQQGTWFFYDKQWGYIAPIASWHDLGYTEHIYIDAAKVMRASEFSPDVEKWQGHPEQYPFVYATIKEALKHGFPKAR